jgi:hypothetical protein
MGVVAHHAEAVMAIDNAPETARHHLKSGQVLADKIASDIRRETNCLGIALDRFNGRAVLLKGAAYLAMGLPTAAGRMFGDLDLLVHRRDIDRAESLLNEAGWSADGTDPYDDAYYRRWTHELPPLEHIERGSIIDLHHAIVQERRSPPVDRSIMIDEAVPLDERFSVLAPTDMVLHACVHLVDDGEFDKGLRDLFDVVSLIRYFDKAVPDFREQLIERACRLALERQLYLALRYTKLMFGVETSNNQFDRLRPAMHSDRVMDQIFLRALQPDHDTAADRWTGMARLVLFVRGHYLRIPLPHLVPHLVRKALIPPRPHPQAISLRPAN